MVIKACVLPILITHPVCWFVCLFVVQLPRAVSTQALSSAGLLRMVNKAADAVNKMTIKMNESDAVSEGGLERRVMGR